VGCCADEHDAGADEETREAVEEEDAGSDQDTSTTTD